MRKSTFVCEIGHFTCECIISHVSRMQIACETITSNFLLNVENSSDYMWFACESHANRSHLIFFEDWSDYMWFACERRSQLKNSVLVRKNRFRMRKTASPVRFACDKIDVYMRYTVLRQTSTFACGSHGNAYFSHAINNRSHAKKFPLLMLQ